MIEYIKGELTELTPTYAVVDCRGVGYNLNISLNTYTAIQGRKEVLLYVYEAIREDAYTLYGFSSKDPQEFCNVVSAGDERQLRSVKGIGPKAAQRIIVDLKDSLAKLVMGASASGKGALSAETVNAEGVEEASSALVMLGFAPAAVRKTVLAIVKQTPAASVEQIIKQALKML